MTKGSTPPMYSRDSPSTELSSDQASSIRYWEMNSASAGIICTTRIMTMSVRRPRKPKRGGATAAKSATVEVTITVIAAAPMLIDIADQKEASCRTEVKFSKVACQGTISGGLASRSSGFWSEDFTIQ